MSFGYDTLIEGAQKNYFRIYYLSSFTYLGYLIHIWILEFEFRLQFLNLDFIVV